LYFTLNDQNTFRVSARTARLIGRENWYYIPSVWVSEGFFMRRSSHFPVIFVNNMSVNVTDCFYRINMKSGFNIRNLSFSFLNTLTLVLAELEGRYYGGGVLELTPKEFASLYIIL